MHSNTKLRRWARKTAFAIAFSVLAFGAARADEHMHGMDGDWLLFLTGDVRVRSPSYLPAQDDFDNVSVDVLYSHSSGHFRVLSESFIALHEADIERLQVGWEFGENTLLWAGRFHQPSSAWNTEHHHGQYLQTAITRPVIERWEDEGGVIPQHIAGGLLETRGGLGETSGLTFSVGAGAAPVISDGQMIPLGPFHGNPGGYRASYSARVGFLPELLGDDTVALVFARHDLNVLDPTIRTVIGGNDAVLDVTGGLVHLSPQDWRFQAAWYSVGIQLDSIATARHEHFGAGYLQVERRLTPELTAFARGESTDSANNCSYLLYQQRQFELRRALGGVRWDLAHHQALTIEAARATTLLGTGNEVRLQWSGVLP